MSLLRRQGQDPGSNPGASPTNTLPGPSNPSSTSSSPSPTSTNPSGSSDGSKSAIFAIISTVIVILLGLLFGFYILRHLRAKYKNPKYIPTKFLKNLWKRWDPDPVRYQLPDTNDSLEPISSRRTRSTNPPDSEALAPNASTATSGAVGVDRNTSVRSVMTLPAYNPTALQSEQVLGREGDRGGIDVVIEFPENADEEESRREEEMEALYQVRLARRRENEEREERRRLRREARERGDFAALREISERARASSAASAGQTVEELRAEHDRIKKERQRAVSSVSYADLGVARHDGTRLRSNSHDSERTGLLGDAASIAASSNYHRRDRSASSIISIDTMNSDLPSGRLNRSRANSRAESPGRISTNTSRPGTSNTAAGSSPEMIDHDDIPPNSPPGYENISLDTPSENPAPTEPPPDYSSPVLARGEYHPTFPSTSEPQNDRRASRASANRNSSGEDRRRFHMGRPVSDSRASNTGSGNSRGVGGIPQLPSLRLASLPSIQVDPGSPIVRPMTVEEEDISHARNEFE